MDNNEKILSCDNLRVSFWTNNGTVKAVRGISFDLYKKKTLAIVGESGSGKSVTSKAVMGLLAGNKIIEEGRILYDGKDLLTLDEDELCKIRGSRIAMIFQDPMSSLNPIMRVGKQLTEVMVLKRKAVIREAKHYSSYISKRLAAIDAEASKAALTFSGEDAALRAALIKLEAENDKEILDALEAALVTLKEIRKNEALSGDGSKFPEILKEYQNIAKALNPCKDYLAQQKDAEIFTFAEKVKLFVQKYKEAIKREEAAAKAAEKLAKNGGEVSEKSELKKRAWSSEIDVSHNAVFETCLKAYDTFLAYLESRIEAYRETESEVEVDKILKRLAQANIDKVSKVDMKEFHDKAVSVMGEVGIPDPERRMKQYPFEFSGGMRQRIVIAIALCSNPEILICDEPTTALDVTIQAQILDLINDLKEKRQLSVIFITHNLGVVANMADDIAIMYAGKIVEYGTADDIFYTPAHPYTWALLNSMPDLDMKERLDSIPGTPPNMIIPPKGDAFAARNKYALQIDFEEQPPFFTISETHKAATWLLDERAPKLDLPQSIKDRIERFNNLNKRIAEKAQKEGE